MKVIETYEIKVADIDLIRRMARNMLTSHFLRWTRAIVHVAKCAVCVGKTADVGFFEVAKPQWEGQE